MQEANYEALEQQVLGIYINCPELLLEDRVDLELFQNGVHRSIYQVILESLQHGQFDASIYYSKMAPDVLTYANKLQDQFFSKAQLPNLLKPLQKRYMVIKSEEMLQQVMHDNLDPLEVSNQLATMCIKFNASGLKATQVKGIEEKQPDWLIPNFIEKNEITIFGGDGGCGKTSVNTNILSALSSGHRCFFETENVNRPKYKILFFSKEDGTAETLRKKFRLQGADMNNLFTFDLDDERLQDVKLGTPIIESLVKVNKPDILVFDPLQSFIDSTLNMSARNQMRQISDSLRAICKKYKVTIIVIMHTNKESKVWGRKRLADSSDLWDGSRSVFMFGESDEDEANYISHEKHNHCKGHETILFKINDMGIPELAGFSNKKDKDFVIGNMRASSSSKIEQAIELILESLEDQDLTFEDIMAKANDEGISERTMVRARTQLKNENKIRSYSEYLGKGKGTRCLYTIDLSQEPEADQKN